MGNQKWTSTEEQALRTGVAKHGEGKWMDILNDPEFAVLSERSNVDLKDKWHNLTIGVGEVQLWLLYLHQKYQSKSPVAASPVPEAPNSAPATSHDDESSQSAADADISPLRYNELIFEALSSINDVNGSQIGAILSFIEQKHEVPRNFKGLLDSKLRRLVRQGKLEKVENRFKLCNETTTVAKSPISKPEDAEPEDSNDPSSSISKEILEAAAEATAKSVAESEHKSFLAKEAVKELEFLEKMKEESLATLQIAEEIYERCCRGEKVILR